MGEDSKDYEDGMVVSAGGSLEAGVDGAEDMGVEENKYYARCIGVVLEVDEDCGRTEAISVETD